MMTDKTKKIVRPNIFKYQSSSIGVNLIISILIGHSLHSNTEGFDARQGVTLQLMLLVLMHLVLMITSSTYYLLRIEEIFKNRFLRLICAYIGIVIPITPVMYLSLKDSMKSPMHESELMFVYSGITLLIIWTFGFYKLNNKYAPQHAV